MARLSIKKANSAVKQVDAPQVTESGDILTTLTPVNGYIADATAFNATFPDPGSGPGLPDLAEPGETIRDKPVFGLTGDWDATRPGDNNVFDQLNSGWSQDVSDGIITYGFFNHMHALGLNNNPHYGEGKGYTPFTEAQKAAARIAIQNWDDLIAADFVETAPSRGAKDWAKKTTDIWLANTSSGPAQAWAYYPGQGNPNERVSGDVWIADPRFNGSNAQLDPGFYGLQTLNHELGHSLGLSHPGDYNFGDDSDGDGVPDPITYEGDAFYFQDNHQYTIMSYFDMFEAGNNQIDWNLMRLVYPSTPMVHDIWVVQQIYGAEMNTRTGATTYGFNATGDVTNDAMRFDIGEMNTIFSIWDAGGVDTLDLSGFYTPSIIDLREGAYSSAGGLGAYDPAWVGVDPSTLTAEDYLAFVNANNTAEGLAARTAAYDLYFGGRAGANEGIPWSDIVGKDWLMENNIGIAYGAVIENAIGGHGDDRINGNQANNEFTGGAGADTFIIADYSGPTLDGQNFDDESIDKIMDFESGVDTIDLSELGVEWADLSFNGTEVTVERGADDLSFIVLGDATVQSDFYFG